MSFNLSKLIQTFIEPANALALLLLLSVLFVRSPWERGQAAAHKLLRLVTFLLLLAALFPVGEWALYPLENRYAHLALPDKADGLILLTGDEDPVLSEHRGQPTPGLAASRYLHLAALARRYPRAKIIITGNTAPFTKTKTTTESLARQILSSTGIDLARVTFEKDALTTYDNARLTARMIKGGQDETWLLVTSAWHMPRAVLCFERQNMKIIPAPTDYQTHDHLHWKPSLDLTRQMQKLKIATHEYYGLLGYWITGRIERPWP